MSYSIDRYRPEDAPQIARLQQHLWGRSPAENAAYLDWKYARNPYTPDPLISIARFDGQVVGMRGMFGGRWELGNGADTIDIPGAADSVIDPDHRDTGLFAEMNAFALEDLEKRGYRMALNLSTSAANYVASVLTLGWRAIGGLQMVTSTRRASAAPLISRTSASRMTRKLFDVGRRARHAAQGAAFSRLDRAASRDALRPIEIELQPRLVEMADLLRRSGPTGRTRHVRDEEYLSWRYQNPRSEYRFLYLGQPLEGYLVLENPKDKPRVFIADWEGVDLDVCSHLVKAAVDHVRFGALETWSAAMAPGRDEMLKNAGFGLAQVPRHSNMFLMRSVSGSMEGLDRLLGGRDLMGLESWDLRVIYSDAH